MKALDYAEYKKFLVNSEWAKKQIGVYNNRFNAVMIVPYPGPPASQLRIIAAAGGGWDHVSVSLPDRCPTWAEMDFIKRLLFRPHEVVVQFHVSEDDHINVHPFCLHLWRRHGRQFPLPPKTMV